MVAASALASASTAPNRKITRARAGPPTAWTIWDCILRPIQRVSDSTPDPIVRKNSLKSTAQP